MNSYGNRVRAAHRRKAASGPWVEIAPRAHFVRKITQHRRMWSAAAAGARAAYWCGGACTLHRVSLSRTLTKSLFSHDIYTIVSSARSDVYWLTRGAVIPPGLPFIFLQKGKDRHPAGSKHCNPPSRSRSAKCNCFVTCTG
jgi:hypothetical protein